MKKIQCFIIAAAGMFCTPPAGAQNTLTVKCEALNIAAKQLSITPEVISEDDPGDLAEAYSYFTARIGTGTGQAADNRLELRFPARVASYQWTQQDNKDKNDSLSAYISYIFDAAVGNSMNAYASDFAITVTRYDAAPNGVIEGSFKGTMQTYGPDGRTLVPVQVSGSFRTTRTGKAGDVCRKARRDEQAVLLNAKNILDNNLYTPLANLGWQVQQENTSIHSSGLVANTPEPYRPMMLCSSFFSAKITADPGGNFAQKLTDSITYYSGLAEKNAADDKLLLQATQNMARIQKMMQWQIDIDENSPYLKGPAMLGDNGIFTLLHITGAAYAYRVHRPGADALSPADDYTVLLFGNWQGADMHAPVYVNYPFVHKQHAAVLENITIKITAPPQLADDVIKGIDWKTFNAAIKL